MKLLLRSVAAIALLIGGGAAAQTYPEKPIRLIVPFDQGGLTSNSARIMAKAIEDNDLLPVPIIISYVPGAAGTIGARQVKDSKPDGYTALIWHVAANGAQAMGNVNFGPDDFKLVAGTDRQCYMLVVRESSEYQTLPELLEAAKANPDTIISADNLGGANHIASVLAEDALPGATFRHVQFGGTAKTYPALLGGHAEVNATSTSSLSSTSTNGLRVLGYMGPERHPDYPDVPTFHELGYDTEFCMYSWWFMPKDTPEDRVAVFRDAMVKAMDTDYMRQQTKAQGVEHIILTGDELNAAMETEKTKISAIGARLRGE
ncbi:Bug family tripartite tricarboxylate transporter substrate binding protein [Martelella mediterranea]|uniref:Tripartite tricarboxylate transporter family receptor n=1 Tax=Martelella mediterranea DSM 17316 TaxID=1122214 RepID=A0A1U9YZL0_9HYPH|nr:tripartite tricarboxylate transporter substrate binding protein [Martelella mediterranea]AQZ50896.1 Tripartite tricarboxylate transporter family receptor [Martelella mediterranea DSM 17316]